MSFEKIPLSKIKLSNMIIKNSFSFHTWFLESYKAQKNNNNKKKKRKNTRRPQKNKSLCLHGIICVVAIELRDIFLVLGGFEVMVCLHLRQIRYFKCTFNTACFATACSTVCIPEQMLTQQVLLMSATVKQLENYSCLMVMENTL